MGVYMETFILSKEKRRRAKAQPKLGQAGEQVVFHTPITGRPTDRKKRIGLAYGEVFRLEPLERIHMIAAGIEPEAFTTIARSMRRSKESFGRLLGMPVTTVERKILKRELLTENQAERVIGAAKLIGQVQTMVEQSGNAAGFDAAQWFDRWLDTPLAALNNRPPSELMSTAEGRELLSRLLSTAQSGAYV